MTREQFAVWLIGYLHVSGCLGMNNANERRGPIDVQGFGDEVLAAARTVDE